MKCAIGIICVLCLCGCASLPWIGDDGPGRISVDGTRLERGGKEWRVVGKSIDWAVQPTSLDAFKRQVDEDAALGINLYFAFASPGLGKPLYAPNGGGRPYDDNQTLARHKWYWVEAGKRLDYANEHGISCVIANTFVDQGVLRKYSQAQLRDDWRRTVKWAEGASCMYVALSEVEEDSGGIATGQMLCREARSVDKRAVVALHPVRTSAPYSGELSLILHQGWSHSRMMQDVANHRKPVICAEDQNAKRNFAKQRDRFHAAESVGGVYILTGWNFGGYPPAMREWLKSL